MLVGGHRTSSTVVLRHITNLPSMTFRADTLVLKFCLRFNGLPDDCLLSLLSSSVPSSLLTQLRKRKMDNWHFRPRWINHDIYGSIGAITTFQIWKYIFLVIAHRLVPFSFSNSDYLL
ncbi:hypothetical protein G6F47_013749 [Rhizopus delemar]|nr:hypothetical protein G6F53_013776 [Rhizopus delemar]KAG1569958.1 hypothetical protein G6F47_013749 [Rhizopus delemar]